MKNFGVIFGNIFVVFSVLVSLINMYKMFVLNEVLTNNELYIGLSMVMLCCMEFIIGEIRKNKK